MASLEHGVHITSRTPFNVASLSKQFTALAVHLLARRGKLSLDDDIRRHLPELAEVSQVVTVRHLLHHTSGLRAYEVLLMLTGWNRDHPLSREQAMAIIARQRTTGFPPGERHQYGNTNYILLAALVERVDGRAFAEFLSQEVFRPLGMSHTQVRTEAMAVIPGRAEHYTQLKPMAFHRNYVWAFAHATGASNVVTTVEDLARWDLNFYSEQVGGAGIAEALYERARLNAGDSAGYASGLEVGEYRGLRTVGHSGSGGGDYYLLRFPHARRTIAVLCNVYRGMSAQDLAFRIADHWMKDRFPPSPVEQLRTAIALPDSVLARFAGEYRNIADPLEQLRFSIRAGTLGYEYETVHYPVVTVGPRTFREGSLTFAFDAPMPAGAQRLEVSRSGWRGTFARWLEAPWQPTSRDLAAFAGTYRSNELDVTWTFAVRDGQVTVRRPRFSERVLVPTDRDAFRFTDEYDDMTLAIHLAFTRDDGGRVTGFLLSTNRVTNLAFSRTADTR